MKSVDVLEVYKISKEESIVILHAYLSLPLQFVHDYNVYLICVVICLSESLMVCIKCS